MPFANARGAVALLFEDSGDRKATRLQQGRRETIEDTAFQAGAPGIATSQESITRRRAHGRGGVCVSKDPARSGQPVQVRGPDLRGGVEAGDVSVAEVVRKDDDDVRGRRCSNRLGDTQGDNGEGEE